MPKRICDVLREASGRLAALPLVAARLEAELLLCQAAGLERTRLLAWPEAQLADSDLERFAALLQRRLAGEPIAYIRGRQAFWTLELQVTPDTLIPRPETELLVELALERLDADAPLRVLDAGSGSGAIAAALASERPAWTLIAAERSMEALRVAAANLRRYSDANTHKLCGDWLAPIANGSLDAVLSNPPYIRHADAHLQQGDLRWEPRSALEAGSQGLGAIRILGAQAARRLRPGGFIALEHGWDQGAAVRSILAEQGFGDPLTHRDLAGHERCTTALLGG